MLKKQNIDIYKKSYMKNKYNKVMHRMLNKVSLTDLIQDADTCLDQEFSINIKTHGVLDQQSSGRCWSFAGLNILREKIIKKCNLDNFELSGSYVAYYDKLEKFNFLLESLILYKHDKKGLYDRDVSFLTGTGLTDGGNFTHFANLVYKYGVVPKSVFPESFASSNTYEINQILSRLLRKFYLDLENNNINEDILKEQYMENAYTIITGVYGMPLESFNFEYTDKHGKYHIDKNITPKEFYDKYIGVNLLEDYVVISSYNDEKVKYNEIYQLGWTSRISGNDDNIVLNLPMMDFQNLIIKQLKSGEVVYIFCSTTSKRIDGVWVDIMERYGEIFDVDLKLDHNSILKTNGTTNGHCMLITGVNIIDGKISRYKIENSWGIKSGKNGYNVATSNWVNNYVHKIVINKRMLTEKQLKILDNDAIKIDKWDIKC